MEVVSDSSSCSICSTESFSDDDIISEENDSFDEEVKEEVHDNLGSERQDHEINSNDAISDSDDEENSTFVISTQSFDQLLEAVMGKLNLDIDFHQVLYGQYMNS